VDTQTFHENNAKRLPYNLSSRKNLTTEVKLNHNRKAIIPVKPLLFLYKLKALRDREHDIATLGARLRAERLEWLRGKRIKDGSDIIALLDPVPVASAVNKEFNLGILNEIVDEYELEFMLQSLEKIPDMNESLLLYKNIEREVVLDWIKILFHK
jgi:hypothetical protein